MNAEHTLALIKELKNPIYAELTQDEGWDKLTKPTVTTVKKTKQVPVSVSLFSLLSAESLTKVIDSQAIMLDIRDKIKEGDIQGVVIWGQILVKTGKITQEEFDGISAELGKTQEYDVSTSTPPRFETFAGVPGFPNEISREDFNNAWSMK